MYMEHDYWIQRWGEGYFSINSKGHVAVKPQRQGLEGDLYELVSSLVQQGIEAPILIRFNGIIKDRIQVISSAFKAAMHEFRYRNTHQMVYPIKVNPQRHVVETVLNSGKEQRMGLEVGSKPELIAALTLENDLQTPLLCNGYKDADYISLALIARKLGKETFIVIEQAYELKLVLECAKQLNIEPAIGFRMKLSSTGAGKWKSSGGEHSKFGLFPHEIMLCVQTLEKEEKLQAVKLLHFHLGSQVTQRDAFKKAISEGARMYTELAHLLPELSFLDVGGGLAVDYDGTKSDTDASMNYTLEEYARDVVSVIGEACLKAQIPDPTIVTESGRAVVTYHSVLITEVIDVSTPSPLKDQFESQHSNIQKLRELEQQLNSENAQDSLVAANAIKDQILDEFISGTLSLQERAEVESHYRSLLPKIYALFLKSSSPPRELHSLSQILQETYFCNFSVFQSLPDFWAIDQLFPIMPIHRLQEPASHKAVLADLTCDSDGKIDTFIGETSPIPSLHLHAYQGHPYYVGIFLVGAYQEILGGLHNLFGDTNVVHAELGPKGNWELSRLVEGDTIEEVLHYVQYNTENLINQLHTLIEQSVRREAISLSESAFYKKKFKQALESYTYLIV